METYYTVYDSEFQLFWTLVFASQQNVPAELSRTVKIDVIAHEGHEEERMVNKTELFLSTAAADKFRLLSVSLRASRLPPLDHIKVVLKMYSGMAMSSGDVVRYGKENKNKLAGNITDCQKMYF